MEARHGRVELEARQPDRSQADGDGGAAARHHGEARGARSEARRPMRFSSQVEPDPDVATVVLLGPPALRRRPEDLDPDIGAQIVWLLKDMAHVAQAWDEAEPIWLAYARKHKLKPPGVGNEWFFAQGVARRLAAQRRVADKPSARTRDRLGPAFHEAGHPCI